MVFVLGELYGRVPARLPVLLREGGRHQVWQDDTGHLERREAEGEYLGQAVREAAGHGDVPDLARHHRWQHPILPGDAWWFASGRQQGPGGVQTETTDRESAVRHPGQHGRLGAHGLEEAGVVSVHNRVDGSGDAGVLGAGRANLRRETVRLDVGVRERLADQRFDGADAGRQSGRCDQAGAHGGSICDRRRLDREGEQPAAAVLDERRW